MLVPFYMNMADLEGLDAALEGSGYPSLASFATDGLINSTGIDLIVYPGFQPTYIFGSWRQLLNNDYASRGSIHLQEIAFTYGVGARIPLLRNLWISPGVGWEFKSVNVELRSVNGVAALSNLDFASAIRYGQGDSTLRRLESSQIAIAPTVHLLWQAFTWKKEDRPAFSLDLGMKAQYNIPISSRMKVEGVYVSAPSFNFSQIPIGIFIGWGMEL